MRKHVRFMDDSVSNTHADPRDEFNYDIVDEIEGVTCDCGGRVFKCQAGKDIRLYCLDCDELNVCIL